MGKKVAGRERGTGKPSSVTGIKRPRACICEGSVHTGLSGPSEDTSSSKRVFSLILSGQ